MAVDKHLTLNQPVRGKAMAGATWLNWGDAVNGSVVAVQGFPQPSPGQDVSYWEAVQFGGQWYDRIGPAPGQGDWCIRDDFVDTLDVSGCIDPADCQAKQPAPPPPAPPPPPPPPAPDPRVDQLVTDVAALKARMAQHSHPVSVSGTTSLSGTSGPPA